MGSYLVTLTPNTPASFTIPAPCYRFQATQVSNAATTYVTGDGTGPAFPQSGTVNNNDGSDRAGDVSGTQHMIPATVGAQIVVQPSLPGSNGHGGTTYPQVQLLSAASPTILVEW